MQRTDPKKVAKLLSYVKAYKGASDRWTDNLMELESWIKNKTGMDSSEVHRNFSIFKNLDYVE